MTSSRALQSSAERFTCRTLEEPSFLLKLAIAGTKYSQHLQAGIDFELNKIWVLTFQPKTEALAMMSYPTLTVSPLHKLLIKFLCCWGWLDSIKLFYNFGDIMFINSVLSAGQKQRLTQNNSDKLIQYLNHFVVLKKICDRYFPLILLMCILKIKSYCSHMSVSDG